MPLSTDDVTYIRHAYQEGMKRGKAQAAPYLEEKLDGAVGFMIAHVDKYSPDQSAWAERKWKEERAWRRGRRVNTAEMIRRLRYGSPQQVTGMEFARYFPHGPEMGQATVPGNIFVGSGLGNLIALWIGLAATGIYGRPLSGTGSVCGVGTGTTAPGTADYTLISAGGSAYFQPFDSLANFATTTTNGVLVGTSTYASAVANFAWNEWCWATGAGAVTAGSNGTSTAGSPFATASSYAMVNHKTAVALGSKASGSSWVFSTTFTIS